MSQEFSPQQSLIDKKTILDVIAKRGSENLESRELVNQWLQQREAAFLGDSLGEKLTAHLDIAEVYKALGDMEAALDELVDARIAAEKAAESARGDIAKKQAEEWVGTILKREDLYRKSQTPNQGDDRAAA